MTPDPSKTYIVSFSGGKDSTATWLYLAKTLGLPHVITCFADTGWEHPKTYEYLDYLETVMGPIVRLKPDLGFVELAKKKKRFPSARARFCTEYLKMKPAKAWLKAEFEAGRLDPANVVQVSGIRHEESPARAKMAEYVEIDDYYKLPQWRPIIAWTWQEVFAIHDQYGVEPNPLYKLGMGRVGCMPPELAEIARRFPEVVEKVNEAEVEVGTSFFGPGSIPDRFCSKTFTSPKTGETHPVATAKDVFSYVQLTKAEKKFGGTLPALFEEPANEDVFGVCSSIYGLCE